MEKAGMKYEGILRKRVFIKGEFRDIKMYGILRSDYA
jgi:[ribosomal protein S5]-alanine N-acetyltransferase